MDDALRPDGQACRAVHLEREYAASPADVWSALTEPGRLARWLGKLAGPYLGTSEPTRLIMGDGPSDWVDITVLRADEHRLLELGWDYPGEAPSVLTITLSATCTGTLLILDHRGLARGQATGYGAGWDAYLIGLLGELGGQDGTGGTWEQRWQQRLPAWRERAQRLAIQPGG
jgi:uncharacterized protein YndB with AHSA1/START domain